VRRLVTAVLVLVLLASACSVVAGGVPRHCREQVVLLYTKYGQSAEQIYDQITGVTDDVPMSLRTIFRIIESFERYGAVLVRGDRREAHAGSPLQGHLTDLLKLVKQQHDLFLNETQIRMHQRTSVMYGRSVLAKALLDRGYTWKVLARMAKERDAQERLAFRRMMSTIDARCLLFIDESHHDRNNTRRRRGRAQRGRTPAVLESFGHDQRFSLLGAMNSTGFVVGACRVIEKRGVNHDDLMDWVRESLCGIDTDGEPIGGRDPLTGERLVPALLQPYLLSHPVPNSVLVLDNASIRYGQDFIELVESTGAIIRYLPPYSPGAFAADHSLL
jgi:hypothetical protein